MIGKTIDVNTAMNMIKEEIIRDLSQAVINSRKSKPSKDNKY